MTSKDQIKMLNAGFTIVKKKDYPRPNKPKRMEIRAKSPYARNWYCLYWLFKSESERDEIFSRLLSDPKIVED